MNESIVQHLDISDYEILHKVEVLMILNTNHAVLNANNQIVYQLTLLNPSDQVLVAGYCV